MSHVDEIVSSLLMVRRAFLKAGMLTPEIIELRTLEEGQKLLRVMDCCLLNEMPPFIKDVQTGLDSFRIECEIAGFKVRWPAR